MSFENVKTIGFCTAQVPSFSGTTVTGPSAPSTKVAWSPVTQATKPTTL